MAESETMNIVVKLSSVGAVLQRVDPIDLRVVLVIVTMPVILHKCGGEENKSDRLISAPNSIFTVYGMCLILISKHTYINVRLIYLGQPMVVINQKVKKPNKAKRSNYNVRGKKN